ncbi:MFS transporter [Halobellus sp. GM3]|uniref:MFS transporter n=1 Tax=Halobellus sp. GM3 TaxID=3458410 RepID=UPI00403E29A1
MSSVTETDVTGSQIPWGSGTLSIILASSLMGVMGVSLISPLLPELRTVFGISDARVGLLLTVYTLPGIVLTPFIGLVADRIGRRRVIIPLLFIFGASGAGIGFVETFQVVLILRFLQGVGASALVTLTVTLIGDFYHGTQQNAVLGVNASMIGTGAALYPLIGGALAGIRWNVPFYFFGVGILVGIVAVVVLPEPDSAQSDDIRAYFGQLRIAAMHPKAVAIFGAIFTLFFVFYGAVQTAVPLLLRDGFALSSGGIGLVLGAVSLSTAVIAAQYGRISARLPAPELILVGFAFCGAGLLGVRLSPSPVFVGASLLAFGLGFGVVTPSIDTTIVSSVSNRLRAGVMGLRTSMLRLGQTVGPVSFTYLAETGFASTVDGYRFLVAAFGSLLLVSATILFVLVRRS